MHSPTQPPVLVLQDGHEIRVDLLDMVRARIPDLDPNWDYTLQQICGNDLWETLPKIQKIRGGSAIAHLVKTGQLALEFATCRHAVPKRYRRK